VGASFRFFASNGAVSPLLLKIPAHASGTFSKACNQNEELGSQIISVSSFTYKTPQATGAEISSFLM
jgi:hypothetical protein